MGILRIMSVGKSGVGKSTIGNMLLFGEPQGEFLTSTSSESCTKDSKASLSKSGDCAYVDVPGIPDTDPAKTADFYNIIITEAKQELNAILFVFKREREDPAAYKLAEMLFRELEKSSAAKILVINDQNNYGFSQPPSEADYKVQAKTISDLTKIDFTHQIAFTTNTMSEKLAELKIMLSITDSYKSKHLKSFTELSEYVDRLRKNKDCQKQVLHEGRLRIDEIKRHLDRLQKTLVVAAASASLASVASFFTFGATLGIATPTAMAAAAATTAIQIKKTELEKEKAKISTENLERAARELEKACEQFDELKNALTVK
ncbi:hypothetical protein HOLleu_25783 [Holothuria leucospilota]|uniref:G domain-containing protein n=1 Tax=Holothuria leucospilota TaxID=206669 RepID=A0A9Q1H3Q8_HOLLE|nr:hypothetical protein HOLleu_25783 [Holothuria leucospilota]